MQIGLCLGPEPCAIEGAWLGIRFGQWAGSSVRILFGEETNVSYSSEITTVSIGIHENTIEAMNHFFFKNSFCL